MADSEPRDRRRDSDLRPSETMGQGPQGQVDFGSMLKLMDRFHDADREIRGEIKELEERRRATDSELFEKLDEATQKITKLETEFENLKDKDEFGDVPWYFRPAWVKSFGLAVAAVIVALAVAFGLKGGDGKAKPPPKPAANPEASEAPGDPFDDPVEEEPDSPGE
jgi:hypothetical protein